MNPRAVGLLALQTMFLARVFGQIFALLAEPSWLPSLEHWMSGLLPYYILLPAQILLLIFMSLVTYDACRQDGYWHVRNQATRDTLRVLATIYFIAVILRYVMTMAFVPELRWLGHTIPIFFHFVLASYLLVLSTEVVERRTAPGQATA